VNPRRCGPGSPPWCPGAWRCSTARCFVNSRRIPANPVTSPELPRIAEPWTRAQVTLPSGARQRISVEKVLSSGWSVPSQPLSRASSGLVRGSSLPQRLLHLLALGDGPGPGSSGCTNRENGRTRKDRRRASQPSPDPDGWRPLRTWSVATPITTLPSGSVTGPARIPTTWPAMVVSTSAILPASAARMATVIRSW